jgi:hypothetical protein
MNAALLLLLLGSLFASLYVIIPIYAPKAQQEEIQDWVGLGFNGILFAMVLYETRFQYMNVYGGILGLLIALSIALSGIYWWIPKYIPKPKQVSVIKDMFTGLSAAVLITNILTHSVPVTIGRFNDMSGGRRR